MTAERRILPADETHLGSPIVGPAPAITALRFTFVLADGSTLELEVDAADWGVSRLGSPAGAPAIYVTRKGGKRSRGKLAPLLAAAAKLPAETCPRCHTADPAGLHVARDSAGGLAVTGCSACRETL